MNSIGGSSLSPLDPECLPRYFDTLLSEDSDDEFNGYRAQADESIFHTPVAVFVLSHRR